MGCLLEVLACFRKDPRLILDLADIAEDDEDKILHPPVAPGIVLFQWLDGRTAATALMSGTFCAVTAAESIAELYPQFIRAALGLGLADCSTPWMPVPWEQGLVRQWPLPTL
ncbi:hypothetical protein [Arthrobacter sp.]|uniref:hypothetical protein n=1 Tax=Arthrobacter sp. TaxID=1667 RepID=UPI0026DF4B21|nr:hypothetical protein [Arthrobacter sp.]MDO5753809.1 hypothetical protein [Arthrobacter sp.]